MWVGIGLGLFLVLVVVLLASPWDFIFYVERRAAWRFRAEVRWLYGSVHFLLPRLKKPVRKPRRKKSGQGKTRGKALSAGQVVEVVTIRGLWRELRRFLTGLFRSLRIHRLSAEWKVGLGDPYQTGLLWAFLGPLSAFASSSGWPLVLVPEFDSTEPELTGMARGTLSLYTLKIIGAALRLGLSRPAFRVYRVLARKEGKR
jgi:hypothetical protein